MGPAHDEDPTECVSPEVLAAHTAGYADGYVDGALVRSRLGTMLRRALLVGAAYAGGALLAELLTGQGARS